MGLHRVEASREAASPATGQGLSTARRADWFWGYLMIAPMLLGLCIFYVWPALQTFYFSFTEWGAFGRYSWSGVDHYQRMISDREVWQALRNTLLYTALSVPISIILAICVAVLLNHQIRGVGLYRTLFFLPAVTMPAAIAMVWQWLFNGDYGLINYLLSVVGLQGPRWLSHPQLALYSIVAVGVWSSIGFNMVIFLSGLQGIPCSYYEAAELDGANHFQIYSRVMLPLAKSGLIALAIITIRWSWNDLLWPLIVINSPTKMVLSAGIASLQGQYLTHYPILMAGAALATWPLILMFFLFQRHFVEGIALSGSKG